MPGKKQVEVTQEILSQIEAVTGTAVPAQDIVVYEATAFSTRPITKRGSIYNSSSADQTMLDQMAVALNSGAQTVPMHTMHQQGYELPIGRVFHASVVPEGGDFNLNAMFYLPKSESDLIEKINLAVIDEVSVSVLSQHAFCSKCGFDYFGPDASYMNFMDQTCNNEHVIGVDGTHLKLSGLNRWTELSLVSLGASSKPKILSRAKASFSQEIVDKLAAEGKSIEAMCLIHSMKLNQPETIPVEQLEALTAQLEALTAKVTALENPILLEAEAIKPPIDYAPQIAALQADLDATKTELADLKANPPTKVIPPQNLPVGGVAASLITEPDHRAHPGPSAYKVKPHTKR